MRQEAVSRACQLLISKLISRDVFQPAPKLEPQTTFEGSSLAKGIDPSAASETFLQYIFGFSRRKADSGSRMTTHTVAIADLGNWPSPSDEFIQRGKYNCASAHPSRWMPTVSSSVRSFFHAVFWVATIPNEWRLGTIIFTLSFFQSFIVLNISLSCRYSTLTCYKLWHMLGFKSYDRCRSFDPRPIIRTL